MRMTFYLGHLSQFILLISFATLIGCQGNTYGTLKMSNALQFSTLTTSKSYSQTAVIQNSGQSSVKISSISVTGTNSSNFYLTNNLCGSTLSPGQSCTVDVSFASSTAGSFEAYLTVVSNGVINPTAQTELMGTATVPAPEVVFSTSTLNLGSVQANSSSTGTVTVTNSGTAALTIDTLSITGTNANFFTDSTTCGSSLAIDASCTISVTFAPLVAGSYSATLNVPNSDSSDSQSVALSATATPSTITIDTTTASDWKISNGVLSIDFNSSLGRVKGITMAGSSTQLVDTTYTDSHGVLGLYMDNSGFGSVTGTANYDYEPATSSTSAYLDWWVTYPSSGTTNTYTYTMHWVVTPNDPGIHVYFVANHATTDSAGSIGQVQWVFRDSLTEFTHTYSINPSVNNPVPLDTPLPSSSEMFTTVTGRNVQDSTWDLHGFSDLPSGWTREFYTKYDHAGYEYLHQAHGLYGDTYGVWTVIPSHESMVAGPSKQDLFFTGNLLMIEAYSNHLDNGLTLTTASGTASSRLFGPFYIRFNKFGTAYTTTGANLATPADLYNDAVTAGNSFSNFYDNEADLVAAGYVPSNDRGTVSVQIGNVANLGSTSTKAAWAILSDNQKNFQYSSAHAQYWADITTSGTATFTNVIPGTYRLSVFEMGQWGEMRIDNVSVTAGSTTNVSQSFVPENFGTTVFTIGTPDRSSHEFLHGHDANGYDYKNYWGSYNYWSDFQANSGSVVYNATTGPAGNATNDLSQWNYNHWGVFDPGLYDSSNSSTDNYINEIPSYVASLSTASGTNGITTKTPTWKVHFASPSNVGNYQYAVFSVALACDYGSYVLTLNSSTTRTWSYSSANECDCSIRSGLSGYYQWIAFQFPISSLNAAGTDNLLTIGVSQTDGAMDDALRLELTNTPVDHTTTGWNDYEYVSTSSTSNNVRASDTVSNP
jgi:hypothetical protein